MESIRMTVKNSIAVITGGASGIGLSCAEQFLLQEAKVAPFNRRNIIDHRD